MKGFEYTNTKCEYTNLLKPVVVVAQGSSHWSLKVRKVVNFEIVQVQEFLKLNDRPLKVIDLCLVCLLCLSGLCYNRVEPCMMKKLHLDTIFNLAFFTVTMSWFWAGELAYQECDILRTVIPLLKDALNRGHPSRKDTNSWQQVPWMHVTSPNHQRTPL